VPEDAQPLREPYVSLTASKECSCENQCFRIDEEVIPQQMRLQASYEPTGLHCQAFNTFDGKRMATQCAFDPVDDTQRRGVGIPSCSLTGTIVFNPSRQELLLPLLPFCGVVRIEVVKVMKVVSP